MRESESPADPHAHIRLDFARGLRPVVDADFVDPAGKVLARAAPIAATPLALTSKRSRL